ncbi:g9123 [Coccomyxa elongata]
MAQKQLAALKRAAEALARLAFFEKLTGTWRLCEYLSATVGSELTLYNVHEHAAVLHMRLLRRQIMLRGDRMCAAAVQTMLFFTRKVLGTMASALSRWSSCVQQRKAKAFRTAMARGLRCHCLLASAFSAWQSCKRENKQLVIKWRANTLVESTEDLIPAEPSTRADTGQFQVVMHEEGCADVDDQDGRQLATPIESNLRLALVPAAETPLLRPSDMEHRYRGVPVASAALRRAAERSSRALPPSTVAAAPLQPPWSPAGVHRACLTEALQTLKARVAQRKHCQQQERTSTRASTQAPLSAGHGRKPAIQPNDDCLNALIVSPISHSSESGQTGKGASVTADTSQTSGCGDADCELLDTGASEPPAKQLCHDAPAQRALESAANAAVQPRQAHMAAIGVTGQSEPCMVMAADQDAGHLSGALGRPGSGQLFPAPPNGAEPTAAANRRTGVQCSESEKHAGSVASKEMHDTSDKQSDQPGRRMQEGRRKLALQGRLAALQRIEAQRSLRTRSDAQSDGPDSEERAASRLYEEHLLRQALEAFQAWAIHSRSERRALLSIVLTSWRCLVACSKADEEVKRAKEQEAVSRAFYQWQLQSLRSRLESVTKALAARDYASPAMADFFALHQHSPVAAIVEVQPTGQAPPPLDTAALPRSGGLTAAMADTQAADVRKAGLEEAGRAALHTSLAAENLKDGPGADVEDAGAEEEPARSMASIWHTKVTEQASPEALTGTKAAEMQDASSAAQMARGEAVPMDVSTLCRSMDRQGTCSEDRGSQAYQAQEPWSPSDEAIQQEASEQIGEAGTRSGSALCTEDAVESAGSCGDTPHPDDDGLHDWLRCSCMGSAEAGLCDQQVSITGMQQNESHEPGMQRAGAIDKVPAEVEHLTGDGPEAAPQLDLGSALSRNGLVPFSDSAWSAGQMACADGLDSPGSPGKGKGQMSAQDMVFDFTPASSAGGPAVGLSAIYSIATAPSACSIEPAGSAGKPTLASNARVQRVHSKQEEDMASRATDDRQISKSPCAAENEGMHAVGGQHCRSAAPTAAAQALMGSPGLPTGQIAPLVCATLSPGGVRMPAMCSDALASPLTLAKRPPAGCGRFALGQLPALPEGAPPDGHRGSGTPSTAPQCRGGSSGRLSQDDSSSGDSSGQGSCMGSSAGEDGSREHLRKRLFHSVDCCQPAGGSPTEGISAPADTCQQIQWSKGAVGPLQQGCMWGGSSLGSTAPQLTPAPLEAGCRGSSRVQSLRASFEAAASCNKARNLLGPAGGQRSHSFTGSRALPRCHPFDDVSKPQRFSFFRQRPRTEESAGSNDMFRWRC